MEGRRLLRSLTLRNVLSFGPEGQTLNFEPLNVLIGPNGSGKSNLIDILALLHSLPRDLAEPINEGGGIRQWIWKGGEQGTRPEIESTWDDGSSQPPIWHRLVLNDLRGRGSVKEEIISLSNFPVPEYRFPSTDESGKVGPFGRQLFDHKAKKLEEIPEKGFRITQSILSQLRDAERYPFLAFLGDWFSELRLYRDWAFGRSAPVRQPQPLGLPDEFLAEDARNLGSVLKRVQKEPEDEKKVINALSALYEGITRIG
jgi:predicted ATPase